MTQRVDLYSILNSYVKKNNSPFVDVEAFVAFLGRYARKNENDYPEWGKWAQDTRPKFKAELAALLEEGKCELIIDHDAPEGKIYFAQYFTDLLGEYYRIIDDNADSPFPNEEILRLTIPDNQVQAVGVGSELAAILDEAPENILPVIRIGFPEEFGTALVLSELVPRRLAESCLLKIRNYLRVYGNKEYAQHKLNPQLMGKESSLKDMLNRILLRPLDCYNAIVDGGEFSYLFWAHFCVMVKNDIKKKKDRLNNDLAAIQAVYIIEALNAYFKTKAAREREKELAFKRFEQNLAKPPYLYTLDQIVRFTSSKGLPLLGVYTREELAERIKTMTNETRENRLPELLVLDGPKLEQFFILKSKMLLLGTRLTIEARDKVKQAISKHWLRLIKNYQSEAAMENDRDFEKSLYYFTGKLCPMLNSLFEDPKFQLVYEEMDQTQEIPPSSRIFIRGELIPYSTLFLLRRRELLEDARLILPFWYSMPILTQIIAFFKNLGHKKTPRDTDYENPPEESGAAAPAPDDAVSGSNREIMNAAREIEYAMVPKNHTIDTYLDELKVRWSRLIGKQARDDLVEDVNALVRDNLRQVLRVHRHYKITYENIMKLAAHILDRSPSLQNLNGKDSLKTYIELYLVKLLETVRL